jgi:ribosomal protein L37E
MSKIVCPKCGSNNIVYFAGELECHNCGYKSKAKRKLGGKTKVIIVTIVAVFISFVAIGSLISSHNNTQSSHNNTQSVTKIEKSVNELLPTMKDIPTEWIINENEPITINADGFSEGVKFSIAKRERLSAKVATISIYKFNTRENAEKYYNDIVTEVKEKRGYKEISTNFQDKSYGTFIESLYGEISTIYLVKSNIYCEISVIGGIITRTENDAKWLTGIVLRKMQG